MAASLFAFFSRLPPPPPPPFSLVPPLPVPLSPPNPSQPLFSLVPSPPVSVMAFPSALACVAGGFVGNMIRWWQNLWGAKPRETWGGRSGFSPLPPQLSRGFAGRFRSSPVREFFHHVPTKPPATQATSAHVIEPIFPPVWVYPPSCI